MRKTHAVAIVTACSLLASCTIVVRGNPEGRRFVSLRIAKTTTRDDTSAQCRILVDGVEKSTKSLGKDNFSDRCSLEGL